MNMKHPSSVATSKQYRLIFSASDKNLDEHETAEQCCHLETGPADILGI
jgi:hypothetical protein